MTVPRKRASAVREPLECETRSELEEQQLADCSSSERESCLSDGSVWFRPIDDTLSRDVRIGPTGGIDHDATPKRPRIQSQLFVPASPASDGKQGNRNAATSPDVIDCPWRRDITSAKYFPEEPHTPIVRQYLLDDGKY